MVFRIVARVRSLWRGLRHRAEVEAEMHEEFLHHVRLRTEDLLRQGLSAQDAARQARLEFGHMEGHKEDARASRGLRLFDQIGFSWLDVKLGVRMLAKYPGLSLVSVVGMSVAIAIGAGGFGLIHAVVDARLPLDEPDRVVLLQNSDARTPGSPDRHAIHDFMVWREELQSVRNLSAYRTEQRNLIVPHGSTGYVRLARMTASGFQVARVAPVLGRPLQEEDERAGAQPVIVIAYEEWKRRFESDPDIIGRTVRLDTVVHTVVGVMPEGFHFPVNHRYWVPLRLDAAAHPVGGGPELMIFGRLADRATLEQAQAQLSVIGRRMASTYPETHEHLHPEIRPYTRASLGIDSPGIAWLLRTVQVALSLFLIVVAVNVAILVYARTAARTGEISVRTALGATRRRVVAQLFAEALVLSLTAAVAGLAIAGFGFEWIERLATQGSAVELPFWIDLGLSPSVVAYVTGLAIVAAAIVGVVPGLRATRRAVQGNLRQLSLGESRPQLGRTWTALIIAQLAVAVAVLPVGMYSAFVFTRWFVVANSDYAVDAFLHASVAIDREGASASLDSAAYDDGLAARFSAGVSELLRRLEAEPEISGAAFANRYPGTESHGPFEVEGGGNRHEVWTNEVSTDLFEVFDIPILAGRGFVESDAAPGANAVIVDRVFVEQILGDGPVLGRRVRQVVRGQDAEGENDVRPWLEIVGVVPAFTSQAPPEDRVPKLYRPLVLAGASGARGAASVRRFPRQVKPHRALQLAVRVRSGTAPATFLDRFREIGAVADPVLRLVELETASDAERQVRRRFLALVFVILGVTGSVLLLSAAGIHAMMSFIVTARRREIGIRIALGAAPRRVLASIFKRASGQLGSGVLIGLGLSNVVARLAGDSDSMLAGERLLVLSMYAVIMLAVGLLAALGPARRALAVQPTEALREE